MPVYGDQAVILRKLDYGEADRIYTLLTRRHGKVGAIAKGVRRSASRLASALELYACVDVQLATGRSLDVVTQVVRLPGPRLEAGVERTAYAAVIAEVADRVTEDRHPVEGVYELTVLALEELARESEPRRASAYFIGRALELLGFAPELSDCASCGTALTAAPAPFSPAAGGFLCGECAVPGMIPVSVSAIKVLRLVAAGEIDLFRRLRLEEPVLAEVEGVLEAQLEHHLDRRLKSLAFLRQLRSMQ